MHEDLVLLESLTPALIAHCLRKRFETGEIYTWVGADHTVLISLNPFKRLPIYGAAALAESQQPSPTRTWTPISAATACDSRFSPVHSTRARARCSSAVCSARAASALRTSCPLVGRRVRVRRGRRSTETVARAARLY